MWARPETGRIQPHPRRRVAAAVAVLAPILVPVLAVPTSSAASAASATSASDASAVGAASVTVTPSACAPRWSLPASGIASLEVTNRSSVTVDTELIDRADGGIVASLEELGAGTTRPLQASLARGSYEMLCTYDNVYGVSITKPYAQRKSSVVTVGRGVPASSATPTAVPTTAAEMAQPVARYDSYVAGQITLLQSDVATLAGDVTQNNLAQAKIDWETAELTFSGIGGTYGAVGPLENDINGLPSGFAGGDTNPDFEGLRKIEYELWSGQPWTAIQPFVSNLENSLRVLAVDWAKGVMTPNLLSTRAHEILEDALRDTLSGDDDQGSGTSLAVAWADLQGEGVVLHLLTGVIDRRAPKLVSVVEPELQSLGQAILATKVGGQWVPLASLTSTQRELIDGDIDQALETLSPLPDLLEVQQFTDGQGS